MNEEKNENLKSDSILSAISDMLIIMDTGFKILYQNQISKDAAGDHTGEYCYRVFEGMEKPCEDCPVVQTFKDGKIHRSERIRVSGKEEKYFETTGSPLMDLSGKITGGLEIARDITRYKLIEHKLMARERQQTAIAEIEYDALTGFGLDVLMDVTANLVANTIRADKCLILEHTPAGFVYQASIGWEKEIFVKPLIDPILSAALISVEPLIIEDLCVESRFHSDLFKENHILSNMSVIIGEQKNPYGIMSVQSMHPRRFTDDEINFLQVASNVVGEAIKRKSAEEALVHARKQAESASMVKTRFLFTVSHELRTPLNSILGFSGLLKRKDSGVLNEKQESYVESVIESGTSLLKIINDILEVAKIDEIKLKKEKIPVSTTIDDVVFQIKEKASLRNILIKKELDPQLEFLVADVHKFKQILSYLLDNAIKFNNAGGNIIISTKKDGNMAKISISDTGIGIREEDIKRLFRGFEQLDSELGRKYGGLGIGLAIAKQLVEQQGGRLEVESRFGDGSTFTFFLP